MVTTVYKLVIKSEKDFKKKQTDSNIIEIVVNKFEDFQIVEEFLKKTYNATDILKTTANKVLYDRTGDISSDELPKHRFFTFHYIVRDFDVVLFKVPKEEGSFVAYYTEEIIYDSLTDF